MSEDLSHGEIQELLGAYALDAVDDSERAIIEAHLETCESCRVELEDHSRLAENLRRHASRVSPLASIESNGTAKTSERVEHAGVSRRWPIPVAMAIVFVLLVGLFAQVQVRFDHLGVRMDRFELLERAQLATSDPAAVVTTLRTPNNDPVLTVVSRAGGGPGFAMYSTLPRLADGQTYELWRVDSAGITAAAVLGRRPDTVMFANPSVVARFLLTVERDPPPGRPTLPAIAVGQISP